MVEQVSGFYCPKCKQDEAFYSGSQMECRNCDYTLQSNHHQVGLVERIIMRCCRSFPCEKCDIQDDCHELWESYQKEDGERENKKPNVGVYYAVSELGGFVSSLTGHDSCISCVHEQVCHRYRTIKKHFRETPVLFYCDDLKLREED